MKDIFSFFEAPRAEPIESVAALRSHLVALGLELVIDEGRARVAALDAAAIRERAHGVVSKPETMSYRTFKPEPDGLFCQKIFGPVADYECACGKYKRMKHRGTVCEKCGVEVIRSSVRRERLGRIDLVAAVAHPLIDGASLEQLAVLPPDLRPLVPLDGGRFATSDLNDLYRRVINRNNRLRRLMELDAPEVIVENERDQLGITVDQLYRNEWTPQPVLGPNKRELRSLIGALASLSTRTIHKAADYSGVAPLVADRSIGDRECRIPRVLARELLRPWVYGELERGGFVTTIKSAKRMVEREAPEAEQALEAVAARTPALLMRGERMVGRELGIWDHPAIGVDPNTAARLGPGPAQIHLPVTEAGRAECRALCDCPRPAASQRSGWLTDLIAGADPLDTLRAAAAGATDELADLAVRAAFRALT